MMVVPTNSTGRTMEEETLVFAHYPFLQESKEFLARTNISFEKVLEDDLFLSARELGVKRVDSAIEERKIPEPSLLTEREVLFELLSYLLGRLVVARIDIDSLTRLYALAEATYYQKRLEAEDDTVFLLQVLHELGLDVRRRETRGVYSDSPGDLERGLGDEEFAVPFDQYLKFTKRMKDPHWKLINQSLERGQVFIDKRRLTRLTRELLFDRFSEEISRLRTPEIMNPAFEKEVKRLKNRYLLLKEELRADDFGEVDIENIPPCMRSISSLIRNGENVSHAGRFALTAFLHMIGLSNEEILQLNKSSPDFDEKIARYQVDHITGTISSTEYTPQSCKTMVSLGLCVNRDLLCAKIGHPLSYYDARNERKKPVGLRLKRLTDFLTTYFWTRRREAIQEFLRGKNEGDLRKHIKTTIQGSPLFRVATTQKKAGKTTGKPQARKPVPAESLADLRLDRRCVLELRLKNSASHERGFIRGLRISVPGAEHSILFSELQGTDTRGRRAEFLPVIDMSLSMDVLRQAGEKRSVICGILPLFNKSYVYIDSLQKNDKTGGRGSETENKQEE